MDVSGPSQRLAALRWLAATLGAAREGAAAPHAVVDAAAALLGPHQLLAQRGGTHEREVGRFLDAAASLLKTGKASDAAAGAQLLGLCCSDAHPATFAASLTGWGEALLQLQARGGTGIAACTAPALARLLARVQELGELQGVKRDAAALLNKAAPQLGAMLRSPENDEVVGGLTLLCAALRALPAPLKSAAGGLEVALLGLLLPPAHGGCPADVRRSAVAAMAGLPGCQGQACAEAWAALAGRCLLAAHTLLDGLLGEGAADGSLRTAGLAALGKVPGWSAWEAALSGDDGPHGPEVRSAAMLNMLSVFDAMLAGSYATPVNVPSTSLILFVTRLLNVDTRSLAETREAVELSARWLPQLHAAALSLLRHCVARLGPAMMPSFGPLARVLAEQLRVVSAIEDDGPMTTPSMVREQLYLCSAQLLRAGGPGVLRDVADSALASCHLELYAEAEAGADAGQPPPAKRRKSGAEPEDGGSGAWRATQHSLLADFSAGRSIGAQAAAIDLVEALFQGGGAVLPAPQRLRLDAMAAHLAATCRAAATAVRRGGQGRDAGGALKSLQAAAYRALLASISTPVPHRPVFLPQAVAAFREGLFDSDAAVSAVCRDALRVVEVMLHPRALPFARELRVAAADSRAPESGALEVPALGQPRMWSALTAQPGLAAWQRPSYGKPWVGDAPLWSTSKSPEHSARHCCHTEVRNYGPQ